MKFAVALALLLTACDNSLDHSPSRPSSPVWEIGPNVRGENYSKGLPATTSGSFTISATAQPHYVTRPISSLVGKSHIRLRYKVEGDGTIHGVGCAETSPSAVTIYVQREDDQWYKNGWRWWHQPSRVPLAGTGEWEIVAPLEPAGWGSIMGMTAEQSPVNWQATLRDTARVGFTFGNCTGAGHGAQATAPMRFTILTFEII